MIAPYRAGTIYILTGAGGAHIFRCHSLGLGIDKHTAVLHGTKEGYKTQQSLKAESKIRQNTIGERMFTQSM